MAEHALPLKLGEGRENDAAIYETADLRQKGVTHKVDITRIPLPDGSYDVVMAHHVLEHIDDDKTAVRELFRLLKPGGTGIFSVPINTSRQETYENSTITDPDQRTAHFSAPDHRRYYGLDFADRLAAAGFVVDIFRMQPEQEPKYGLLRDEWIYIAGKPAAG